MEFYLSRFVEHFKLNIETDGVHLDLLEDELHQTNHLNHPLPEDQIDVAMRVTYYSHVQVLVCAFSTSQDQPAALATNDTAPANLEIDAVTPHHSTMLGMLAAQHVNKLLRPVVVLAMVLTMITVMMEIIIIIILMTMVVVMAMVVVMLTHLHHHLHLHL